MISDPFSEVWDDVEVVPTRDLSTFGHGTGEAVFPAFGSVPGAGGEVFGIGGGATGEGEGCEEEQE